VDSLFEQASIEADPDTRRALLEQINQEMHDDPPVIFLWNLTASYAVSGEGESWEPRGSDQILPLAMPAKTE
jgi:ABC-type transport system substrate-binding protein